MQKSAHCETFGISCSAVEQTILDIVKDAWHGRLLLFCSSIVSPHAVLDIIVDDKVEFFVREAIMTG